MEQQTAGPGPAQTTGENVVIIEERVETNIRTGFKKLESGVRISLLISILFYLAMLIVGAWGVNKCPSSKNIPLFLIVTGFIGVVSKCISYLRAKLQPYFQVQYTESSLYTIELVFMILGSFWVYTAYQPNYDPSKPNYCNKTVYMFAFIYLAVFYAIMFAIFTGFLCFLGCIFFVKSTASAEARDVEAQAQLNQPRGNKDYGSAAEGTTEEA